MCISLTISTFYSANELADMMLLSPSTVIEGNTTGAIPAIPSCTAMPATPAEEATKVFRANTLSVMIGSILIGSVFTYYLTGKALKPLEELTESVAKRTVYTLNQELPQSNKSDEVFRLSQAFQQMSDEILHSYEVQKNFSANAAHELCTPLAVLQAKLDVFEMKSGRTPEEYDALIAAVNENTQRLSQIVSDLMELTNHKAIDMTQHIPLKDMLEEILYDMEKLAQPYNISLSLEGDNLTVVGNDGLLQQAFYNVIANAIKYNAKMDLSQFPFGKAGKMQLCLLLIRALVFQRTARYTCLSRSIG